MLPGEGSTLSNAPVPAPASVPAPACMPAPVPAPARMPAPAFMPAPMPPPMSLAMSGPMPAPAPLPMLAPAPLPMPAPAPMAAKDQSGTLSGHASSNQAATSKHSGKSVLKKEVPPKPVVSRYQRKYNQLKSHIKDLVLMNVAYCDQIAETQDKMLVAMGKRRYLAKKLLQHQTASETDNQLQIGDLNTGDHSVSSAVSSPPKKVALKKRPAVMADTSSGGIKLHKEVLKPNSSLKIHKDFTKVKLLKETTKVAKDGVRIILKPKKTRMMKPKPLFQGMATSMPKKHVQSVPLDGFSRPVIPILLGDLIIDSLGDIIHDRPAYHTNDTIYPVGFRSSRVYGSTKYPGTRCIYSCKISDGGAYPKFEINIDGETNKSVMGDTPDSCHLILLQQIKQNFGINLVKNVGRGSEFFGLKHPVVLHALQGLPGCKRCLKYRPSRYEVVTTAEELPEENDPAINYKSLQKVIDKPLYRVGLKFGEEGF